MNQFTIPPDLIINFDVIGLAMVPSSDLTLAEKGSKEVPMIGIDDKRHITAVMGCIISRKLLPAVSLPEGWDIWHSKSH